MFLVEFCWDTAAATLVTKTSSGEGRDYGLTGPIATGIGLRMFYSLLSAKNTDETDKWEAADGADIAVVQSSEVLRNTVLFVVLENTPGHSQAILPKKMSGFINEITASEISPVYWGAQVSKMRGQKIWWPTSASFFFLMKLEIQEKLLIWLCLIWVRKIQQNFNFGEFLDISLQLWHDSQYFFSYPKHCGLQKIQDYLSWHLEMASLV